MKRPALAAACLLALTVLAYAGAFRATFVYDDRPLILNNSRVTTPEAFWRYWTDPHLIGGQDLRGFRPLTLLSFSWNYRLAGANRAVFHGTSVAIHGLTVLAVWVLCRRLLRGTPPEALATDQAAFLAAALFAVHPALSQAVLFLTARSALIATCGIIYAAICYDILLHQIYETRRAGYAWYAGVVVCWFIGLSGRESAIAGAILFAGLEWLRWRRGTDGWRLRSAVVRLAPLALLGCGYLAWVFGAVQAQATTPPARSWASHLLGQLGAAWEYTKLLVWPQGLALDHGAEHLAEAWTLETALGVGVLGALCLIAWLCRKRAPVVTLGVVASLVLVGPESYAVPLKIVVNEHRLYLPLTCGALVLAGALTPLLRRYGRTVYAAGACVIAASALGTCLRSVTWRSPETVWADAWLKYPRGCRAPAHLGQLALESDHLREALEFLTAATTCNPVRLEPRLLLITAHGRLGDAAEVRRLGSGVLADFPQESTAYSTVGTSLAEAGRVQEAIPYWKHALSLDPGNEAAAWNLARALETGESGEIAEN